MLISRIGDHAPRLATLLGLAALLWLTPTAHSVVWAQDDEQPADDLAAEADEALDEPAIDEAGASDASSTTTGSDEVRSTNMFSWFYQAAGLFFWIQLPMSILLVAMIIMYALQVMRNEFLPESFVVEFETMLRDKQYQQAYDLAKDNPSLLARVVTTGLARLSTGGGYPQALEAMQEVGEDEGMKFDHRLSYLAMLGNIATMVGLLGTVVGMVSAFMVIAESNTTPKPSELALGVSQALVTTVWGLSQAIPAVVAHTIIKNRVARLMLEVGIASEGLMNRFSAVGTGKSRTTGSAATPSATA